jgi:hypothetical protein
VGGFVLGEVFGAMTAKRLALLLGVVIMRDEAGGNPRR